MIRPPNVSPGKAVSVAVAFCPIRTDPDWASGTAAFSQTVPMPLIWASVWPAPRVTPCRASSVWMTPEIGEVMVTVPFVRPLRSTLEISPSDMPISRNRWRAAAVSSGLPSRLTLKNSVCAPPHSGSSTSAIGAPARITSPGARA